MKTLRIKLLFIFMLLTSVPLLVSGYLSYQTQKNDLTERLEQTLFIFSESVSAAIEELIRERLTDVRQLANNPNLTVEDPQPHIIREEFFKFMENHDLYYGLIFVDKNGEVITDTDGTVVGNNLSTRNWFQETLKGDEVYLSDIYLSEVIDGPLVVMAARVSTPEGETVGVISPSFDLEYLWDYLGEKINTFSTQQQGYHHSSFTFMLNEQGEYIAHPNRDIVLKENFLDEVDGGKQVLQGENSETRLIENDEEGTVNALAPVGQMEGFSNQWYVGVSVPKEELYAPLRNLMFTYIALFSAVIFITGFAVVRLSRYIVKPVERLVSATKDFALGKRVFPLKSDSYEEVNTLTRTFNEMTKRLEEREKGHKKSTLILETTDNGVISINRINNHITTFNRTCEQIFQVKKEDVLYRPLLEVKQQFPSIASFMENVPLFALSKTHENGQVYEFDCDIGSEPRSFFVSTSLMPHLDDETSIEDILLVFNDVTDKRRMEKELLRSEKLKVVGQMAAGFAHEIRNPLTTIRGFLQMAYKSKDEHGFSDHHYEIIISEIDRVNSIVEDLLSMARIEKKEKEEEIHVDTVLSDVLSLFKSKAEDQGITINDTFRANIKAWGNEKKLKQVFMNIIKNAIEAMPKGGHLSVQTTVIQGKGIKMILADTGKGMDEVTLKKLGTPFYTTKESGTGLGMMTSFKVIEEMGGNIDVNSSKDIGTTFTIYLPVKEKKEEEKKLKVSELK